MVSQHYSLDSAALIAGVDTHMDTHTLAVLTTQGGVVSTETFTADKPGYGQLINALRQAGDVAVVGVEGTNSYGAGLTRALQQAGYTVKEVLRPARQVRRMHGKSDPIDAVEAARTVIAGHGVSEAKNTTTAAESLRYLHAARARLVTTMTTIANSITSLLVTAADPLRDKYRGLTTPTLIKRLAVARPGNQSDPVHTASLHALKQLAKAHIDAHQRADELEHWIRQLVNTHYPAVAGIYGAGPVTAAELVITAGGNPDRIRNEAALASLTGTAPLPASSGKTTRHRLNRGGDRRGNKALHRIALIRTQHDQRTRDYVDRRTREGKTTKEIMRCLKRAIAREAYRALNITQTLATEPDLKTLRESKNLTLTDAARHLNTRPARISDIEKHRRPLPELTTHYKQWLQTA